MNLHGYQNIARANQQKLETYRLEGQTQQPLSATKPPSPLRQRLALWLKRVAGWLEAYPPIVEYQPLSPLKFR